MEKIDSATGGRFDKQQFVRLLLGSCRDEKSTLRLLRCSHDSIYRGALAALDYGVVIGGPASEASLVPFGGEAQLIVEYRGWKRLARNSPLVDDVEFEVVRSGDEFEFINARTEPNHKYSKSKTRNLDPVEGAYALVFFANGRVRCTYWSVEECIAHRNRYSPSWKRDTSENNLWHEKHPSFGVMCAKTVFLWMCHRGDCPIELGNGRSVKELFKTQGEHLGDLDDDEPMEGVVLSTTLHEGDPTEMNEDGSQKYPPVAEAETVPAKPDPTIKAKDEDPTFEYTGIMCLNLQNALADCKTLGRVGVIRDYALGQARDDSEKDFVYDMAKRREEQIRAKRSKKAASDQ